MEKFHFRRLYLYTGAITNANERIETAANGKTKNQRHCPGQDAEQHDHRYQLRINKIISDQAQWNRPVKVQLNRPYEEQAETSQATSSDNNVGPLNSIGN